MVSTTRRNGSVLVLASLLFLPTAAHAQVGIAGAVTDTTGGVLPGVTVVAASPALIEQLRTVVADSRGRYNITDLRPGVYSVTFTLPGFATVIREGIELAGTFTATVNTVMRVGAVEETITVSGQSPVVDVQNVSQTQVISSDVIAALPTARTYQGLAAAIPGISLGNIMRLSAQDVGGSASMASHRLTIHGSRTRDLQNTVDGIPNNNGNGVANAGLWIDAGAMEEFDFKLGSHSAESMTGGVHVNMVPREGGNRFAGSLFSTYTGQKFQSDNHTAELQARGLPSVNALDKMWDVNPSFGGPIIQNRLWFFGSARYWGVHEQVAGMWHDADPFDYVFTPDLSRPAIDDSYIVSVSMRPTWQVAPQHKVVGYFVNMDRCLCHSRMSTTRPPEATTRNWHSGNHFESVRYTWVPSSRVLVEAGWSYLDLMYNTSPQAHVTPDLLAVTERATGLQLRAPAQHGRHHFGPSINYKASVTYVTGSHAFKVGFNLQDAERESFRIVNGDVNLRLLNGVPQSIVVHTTPYSTKEQANALGIFAQDQWTMDRLTLNLGVRFDFHNGTVPRHTLPAARFVPARDFAAISDVPNWKDISPRLGVSYDLFGTGSTALKVTLNRYMNGELQGFASRNNPIRTSVNTATRTWTDLNGDFFPQEQELGQLSNAYFGKVLIRTRYDDALRSGRGLRPYNWETSAGVQHELLQGVSVGASYHRRWYGNFEATDNLEVSPADYDPFCITGPVDARLPGGGGQQICGLYDITPAKYGLSDNFVTFAKSFGTQTDVYDGVDLTTSARLPNGVLVSGGLNVGRERTNRCFVIDSPEEKRFCDVRPPFQTQVRFLGSVPLPWDLQVAGTFQTLPGPGILATGVVKNDAIRASLGRDLARGPRGTHRVQFVSPGTMYAERLYQTDLRLSKIVQVGRVRIQGNLDLYNLFNVSPVLALNSTFGPRWQQPQYVLPGRLFKFGAQVDF